MFLPVTTNFPKKYSLKPLSIVFSFFPTYLRSSFQHIRFMPCFSLARLCRYKLLNVNYFNNQVLFFRFSKTLVLRFIIASTSIIKFQKFVQLFCIILNPSLLRTLEFVLFIIRYIHHKYAVHLLVTNAQIMLFIRASPDELLVFYYVTTGVM